MSTSPSSVSSRPDTKVEPQIWKPLANQPLVGHKRGREDGIQGDGRDQSKRLCLTTVQVVDSIAALLTIKLPSAHMTSQLSALESMVGPLTPSHIGRMIRSFITDKPQPLDLTSLIEATLQKYAQVVTPSIQILYLHLMLLSITSLHSGILDKTEYDKLGVMLYMKLSQSLPKPEDYFHLLAMAANTTHKQRNSDSCHAYMDLWDWLTRNTHRARNERHDGVILLYCMRLVNANNSHPLRTKFTMLLAAIIKITPPTTWSHVDVSGETVLMMLCRLGSGGNLSVLVRILDQCPPILCPSGGGLDARDRHGQTLLLRLVENGADSNVVSRLIESKASVNQSDHSLTTPVLAAIHRQDPDILRLLVDAGADVNATDNAGRIPLQVLNTMQTVMPTTTYKSMYGILTPW
jgi:hypothetical protein